MASLYRKSKANVVPIIFVATIIIIFIVMTGSNSAHGEHYELSTVTGYFQQDDPATDAKDFDFVCGFGIEASL